MSTLFKQIYRYTRSRAYRHNENIWPFCRISRASTGEIVQLSYKGKIVPLITLTNWYKQFTGNVLIVATGPSINKIDLSKISNMTVMGVNGAYTLKDHLVFQLYTIVDMSFIDYRIDIIKSIISDPRIILFTTLHGIIRIIDRFALAAIQCQLTLIEDACYRIYEPRVPQDSIGRYFAQQPSVYLSTDHPNIAFTTDIRNGIFDAGTVVFWVLQILFYLGFTHFYIVGLDMANFHEPRFYETNQDKLLSSLEEHFRSSIIPGFILASKILQQNGVEVKNLSLNSALSNDIFKKISFNEIF